MAETVDESDSGLLNDQMAHGESQIPSDSQKEEPGGDRIVEWMLKDMTELEDEGHRVSSTLIWLLFPSTFF